MHRRRGVTLAGANASADLGGSSDYSSARLEGLSGEGFRVQVSLPRLSRPLEAQEMPLIGKSPSGYHCPYLKGKDGWPVRDACITANGVDNSPCLGIPGVTLKHRLDRGSRSRVLT